MAQQFDIVGNLLLKVDGAEAGINKLKNSLSKLELPKGLENSFKKSFSNLDGILARYRSQIEKGFETKGDVSAFTKTGKELDAELNRLSKHFTELTGKEINFRVKSEDLTKAEKDLTSLIEKKNQFTQDTLKLTIEDSKVKEVKALLDSLQSSAGNTKAGQAVGNALASLQTGDIKQTITYLEQAEVAVKRLGDAKKTTFQQETGLGMADAITKLITLLKTAEGESEHFGTAIKTAEELVAQIRGEQVQKVADYANNAAAGFEKESSALKQVNGQMQEYARASQSMSQQLGDLKTTTQYFFGLRNMINLLKRGIREAVDTVKELDKAMTETAVVTKFDVGDMWAKLPEYTANANKLGATVLDMYKSATLYYQQGLNAQQAMEIASETMKMARIGGLEAAAATDMMTAALRGFNMEINEASAQRINDVYSNLAAKTASNTQELGTAMQRTASIAASAGMSFEGTAAFLAQAIETTREPAENLGTAMKTIVARFTELKKNPLEITEVDGEEVSYNKVDAALQSIGVSLKDANGQFRDLDQVFLDISQRWDSLTQTQQRYVATQAAGSRQQSRFIAMMSNYERTLQLMDYANNSAGASQDQFGKTLDSLEAKLNKFQNAWKQFLMNIMNDSWIKKLVDGGTQIFDTLNKIINTLSGGGKYKGIKSFLSLFAAFTGLRMAGKGINMGIGALGGMLDPNSTARAGFKAGAIKNMDPAAISNPIVKAIHQLQMALTNKAASPLNTGPANYDVFKNSYGNLKSLIAQTGENNSLSLSEAYGKISNLDDRQQASVLGQMPALSMALKKNGITFKPKDVESPANKLVNTFTEEVNKGLANKTISTPAALKMFGTPKEFKQAMASMGDEYAAAAEEILYGGYDEAGVAEKLKQQYLDSGNNYSNEEATKMAQKAAATTEKEAYANQRLASTFGTTIPAGAALAQKLGDIGGKAMMAGQAIAQLGTNLSNAGFDVIGGMVTDLGYKISSLGMAISGLGPAFAAVKTAFMGQGLLGGLKNLFNAHPYIMAATTIITALVAIRTVIKTIEKRAQEAGKKVRESFEENFTKAGEKITSLENYKTRFNELAQGVDEFGHNINLSAEEYDEYLNISRELKDLSPELIAGYNAEGEAIIKKGDAIQEVINRLKNAKLEELDKFTKDSSINKLIGEYKTSDAYKNHRKTTRGKDDTIVNAFDAERNEIVSLDDSKLDFKLVDAVNQLTGWDIDSLNSLTTSQLSWLSKHYNDVIGLIEEKNGQLDNEVKEGYIDAFTNVDTAIDEVMAEGQPVVEAMQQWMGAESIDAVGLGLGEEFADSFNQGFEDIMLTGLTQGWDANTFKTNLKDYSKEWNNLAGSTSDYASIMEEAKKVQDEYLDSMGSDTAVQDYNKNITESCQGLIELANNTDTATEAGRAFQQQCIAQANALRNYATEGGMALSEALNTATDDIQRAESALDDFNEATKTDLYTAAEGMRSIYDKAFETYEDSFGGEYEKHFEGKGDHTAWEAARTLLDEDVLESVPDGQALKEKLQEWEPALREGEEGWYNFWTKITGDSQLMENLNAIDGVHWDEDDFYIPEDKWAEVAKTIGISEEMLTSMLNKGRQFANIDFTNWGQARHTFETSDVGIEGTASTANAGGQRKLFIKEETFEAALADANYKPEEYEGKKAEAREQQNFEFLKAASEYNSKELQALFRDEMGLGSLTDLISTLYSTGDYNKEEIEAYAEKAGYTGDFDTAYDKIAEAIDNPELYKQTSVLERISAQIANLDDESTTAKDALKDRNKFASELYGTLGKIDSEADYFAHGEDTEGKKLTTEEYEATKQSLEAQKILAEERASMAEARAATASSPEDQSKWLEVAEKYSQDASNIETYLAMAASAFEASEQEKSTLTQQATEQAQQLAESNASSEEIKNSMVEAANKMAEAQMKPEDIAAALNKSYGTNLEGSDVNVGKDGTVELNVDQAKLEEQLQNLHADIEANITGVSMGARASGQNNPNSMFHRHGTMARGSRGGYVISGRPTLTGEEGEELVWEPKRNQAYMVGSNGPQFANISKDAVVWNAAQTKQIKKNSKVGSFGTGARGIARFGTMAGGSGGLKIPGVLEVDANATIMDVIDPPEKPTISVRAELENKKTIEKIDATAEVTQVVKSGTIAGEPISVQAVAKATKVQNETPAPKVSAQSQTVNVTAETGQAQSKINQLISVFNRTYTLKYQASGPTSISVPISANFTGSWEKTVKITKAAKGMNNHIGHYAAPVFGSVAKGRYGTIGPKGKGGLTLTGEKGFEIAWLPSENRSMVLGANGPQMLNLPSDTVIYTHEQSKKILKQKSIPAGSHAADARGSYNASSSRYANTTPTTTTTTTTTKKIRDAADNANNASEAAEEAANTVQRVSVWWENIARRTELTQRRMDKNQKAYEKYLKNIKATLQQTGWASGGKGDAYIKQLNKYISLNKQQVTKANQELYRLDNGSSAYDQKKRKQDWINGAEWLEKISFKNEKGDTVTVFNQLSGYIKKLKDGSYQVDQDELNKLTNLDQRKAVADAAQKAIDDRLSKKYKAEDNIEKAREELEKFAETLYETFFGWETSLTKIWNITQKIENYTSKLDRTDSFTSLLEARLGSGNLKASDTTVAKDIQLFRQKLKEQNKIIQLRQDAIDQTKADIKDLINKTKEKNELQDIQNRLTADKNLPTLRKRQAAAAKKVRDAKKANKALTKEETKLNKIVNSKKSTAKEKKAAKQRLKQIAATKKSNTNIITKQAKVRDNLTKKINDAVSLVGANGLNATQRKGYQQAIKENQKRQAIIDKAQRYTSITRNADGTLNINFNADLLESDRRKGLLTADMAKGIEDYVNKLKESSDQLNDLYKELTNDLTEYQNMLKDLKDQWADYENQLIQMNKQKNQKELDRIKKLSDSIKNAIDELLKEVKRRLDQRRQEEENRNTEADISKKQQRLAALRADTSGGHQVEIAQLEKEIAEAQNNYQKTLEDQLLDRLQQEADDAHQQRERQIKLQEALLDSMNNIIMVDTWMTNPKKYKKQIQDAFRAANDYENKGIWGQEKINREFQTFYQGLRTNQNKQKQLQKAIDDNTAALKQLTLAQKAALLNVKTVRKEGISLASAHKDYGYGYKELKEKGGYTASEFKKAGVGAKTAHNAGFSFRELRKAGYTAQNFKKSGLTINDARAAGFKDSEIAKAWGASSAMRFGNVSGISAQKGTGKTAKQLQAIVNKSPNDKATQKDMAGVQVGKVDVNGKKEGGIISDSHISANGKRVSANSGSTLYTAAWDTKKGEVKGKWKAYPIDKLTAALVKNYPTDAKQALRYAITHQTVGSVINKQFKELVTAAKMTGDTGKTFTLSNGGKSSINKTGNIYYANGKDIKIWNPMTGKLSGQKYDLKKYKDLAKNKYIGRVYKEVLHARGVKGYKTGGLATTTGPAWLDGTPSKPELVLNATDTKNFLALKDVLAGAMKGMGDTSNTYSDIKYEININVDKIEKDYDVDRVVKKVKEEITKGAGYRNVTQVRNFR